MKFLVDRMLGKLAKELRMLGYDSAYYKGVDTAHLLRMAHQEGRAILTRNGRLSPATSKDRIVRIIQDDPYLQLKELIDQRCISGDEVRPFSRCLLCNALLAEIPRGEAEGRVPEYVLYHQKEFFRCPDCSRIYWKGSHQQKMEKWVEELFGPREVSN